MNKSIIYSIFGFIFLAMLVIGGTYAFFTASSGSGNNDVASTGRKYEVIYSGETVIDEELKMTTSRDGGIFNSVSIRMGTDSALPKLFLYLNIADISDNMINNNTTNWQSALHFEVYGYDTNDSLVYSKTGTFMNCSTSKKKTCVNGDFLYLVDDYRLTYTDTRFDVYIWLDAAMVDNGVIGSYFSGNIVAQTEEFTGDLG